MTEDLVQRELIKLEQLVNQHWPEPPWTDPGLLDYRTWVLALKSLVRHGALDVTQAIIADTRDVDLHELVYIAHHGKWVTCASPEGRGTFVGPYAVAGQCHALAVVHYLAAPARWQIWSGFADGHHFHSWLVHESGETLLEPTPILRDRYFGAPVPDITACLEAEIETITRLHHEQSIDPKVYRRAMLALTEHLKSHHPS